MKTINSIKILISITTAALVFHFFVLFKFVSYKIAWGGNLKTDEEMYVFQTVSIAINLFFIWVLSMKGNLVTSKFSNKAIDIILWIFFAIFLLNTFGNILAKTWTEKMFAMLTAATAMLLWFALRKK